MATARKETLFSLICIIAVLSLAGCTSSGGTTHMTTTNGGGGGGTPPANSGDIYFPGAPMGMWMDTTNFMVQFQVAYLSPTGGAVDVAWEMRRASGVVVASGTETAVASGQSRDVSAMAPADPNETFTLVLDPQNVVVESSEDNNTVDITAVQEGGGGGTTPDVDVQFTDAHYHGLYYYNDLAVHFYVMNPNHNHNDAHNVTFTISDGDTVIYGPSPVGPTSATPGTVPAPTDDEISSGTGYPVVETNLTAADIFGSDPNNPNRPAPGRHVFKYELQAPGDTNIVNNVRYFTVDVPTDKHITQQTNAVQQPDIQLQDPHFHQYPDHVVFHFFISDVQRTTDDSGNVNPSIRVPWRIIRDSDGAVLFADDTGPYVAPGGVRQSPPPTEVSMSYSETGSGLEAYHLILDPDNVIDETNEDDNQVQFLIDWTPTSSG